MRVLGQNMAWLMEKMHRWEDGQNFFFEYWIVQSSISAMISVCAWTLQGCFALCTISGSLFHFGQRYSRQRVTMVSWYISLENIPHDLMYHMFISLNVDHEAGKSRATSVYPPLCFVIDLCPSLLCIFQLIAARCHQTFGSGLNSNGGLTLASPSIANSMRIIPCRKR
jgi:hypothetical protein